MINRSILIATVLSAVVIAGAVAAVACSSRETPEPIDLSTIHTTPADTASPPPSSQTGETPVEVTLESPGESSGAISKGESIAYEISLYTDTNRSISIRYPTISNMSDKAKQEEINQLLKENALSVLTDFSENLDQLTLDISCQVPSISRNRITAVYTGIASVEGAAHPVNLFYTNTVDLNSGKDLGFHDYADPYTMAGYLLSDDVQFDGLSGDRLADALSARAEMDIAYYTEIFEHADFPLDSDGTWPSSFSYEKQGEIYFSIPVPHALGDYVIVKFIPQTK